MLGQNQLQTAKLAFLPLMHQVETLARIGKRMDATTLANQRTQLLQSIVQGVEQIRLECQKGRVDESAPRAEQINRAYEALEAVANDLLVAALSIR